MSDLTGGLLPHILPHETDIWSGRMAFASEHPALASRMIEPEGMVSVERLAADLHLTRGDLAGLLGMSRDSLSKSARVSSIATQRRLRDFVEILSRALPWAGSLPQAHAWFCAQPLPSFGDQTAADLVREGRADAVKAYLARIAVGGYA